MVTGSPAEYVWEGPAPLAVVVDLDDTLYPQAAYLDGAVRAVGAAAGTQGLDGAAVATALAAEIAAGSDTGGTIDRALRANGVTDAALPDHIPDLVAAFIHHQPRSLPLYSGVAVALDALAGAVPIACLTDGHPAIQAAKLAATGLDRMLPIVVVTDALGGRASRKPHSSGLLEIAAQLGVPVNRLLVIGDRPTKDVAAAAAVGARAIRIRQGEYADAPDEPMAWAVVESFPAAAGIALSIVDRQGVPLSGGTPVG